jgi:hypothetical protein
MEGPDHFMDDFCNLHVKEGVAVGQIKELTAPHWLSFPPTHPFIVDFIASSTPSYVFATISQWIHSFHFHQRH